MIHIPPLMHKIIAKSMSVLCTLLLFNLTNGYSQSTFDLRKNFTNKKNDFTNTIYYYPINKNDELDYVSPLKSIFFDTKLYGKSSTESMLQLLSMVENEKSIENFGTKKATPSSSYNKEFNEYISQFQSINTLIPILDTCKVIMINESHIHVQPRSFLLFLLNKLKKKGYTHLAMETLNYNDLNNVSSNTGYYTMEPIMAEVVRTAIKLGFILVPYEDTNARNHSPQERETTQANNLWQAVRKASSKSKFIVVAGYNHIAELPETDKNITYDLYTMAMQFKKVSNINPYTINQVNGFMDDKSKDSIFIKKVQEKIKYPSSKVLYAGSKTWQSLWHFDAFIVHSTNEYKYGRPTWLDCYGIRKETKIKCNNSKTIIVQAYYKNEIDSDNDFNIRIPSDQCIYLDNHFFAHLYLIPKNEYYIVFRDENNKIIRKRTIRN